MMMMAQEVLTRLTVNATARSVRPGRRTRVFIESAHAGLRDDDVHARSVALVVAQPIIFRAVSVRERADARTGHGGRAREIRLLATTTAIATTACRRLRANRPALRRRARARIAKFRETARYKNVVSDLYELYATTDAAA